MSAADVVGTVSDAVTLATVVVALVLARRGWTRRVLTSSRRRSFRAAGAPRISRRHVSAWVAGMLSGVPRDAATELDWLCRRLGLGDTAALALVLDGPTQARLADAYQRHAARLRARALIGTAAVPAIAEDARIAELTAEQLRLGASGAPVPPVRVALATGDDVEITLVDPLARADGVLARDLVVSYRRERVLPQTEPDAGPGWDGETALRYLPTSHAERARLRGALSSGMLFDGVLPRLVAWRSERDSESGRRRLHLVLGECTYSAVLLDHYPPAAQVPPAYRARGVGDAARVVDGAHVGLLTLSLVLQAADGRLLLVERSGTAGSHEGRFGPSVNGNAEMRSRRGLVADADGFGLPDLRAAICREAAEELGAVVRPDWVSVTGLARFSSPTERGTYVLTMFARLDASVEEILSGLHHADPLEGRWEVGERILAVPVPRDELGLDRLGRWLVGSEEVVPHARAAVIAALGGLVDVGDLGARAARWAADPSTVRPPEVSELAVGAR